jgi:hypothetical protein
MEALEEVGQAEQVQDMVVVVEVILEVALGLLITIHMVLAGGGDLSTLEVNKITLQA